MRNELSARRRLLARLHLFLAIIINSCVGVRGAGLLDDMGFDTNASRQARDHTCAPKPAPRRPAQHSAAEGLPPLPLPVVPLRRTEKKNPPKPPVLIAKISTGDRRDWATNPSDTQNLLRWMAKELDVHFSTINMPAHNVPEDPREVPLLYRTGHNAFSFSADIRVRLRAYLLTGGTLVLDACCGHPEFAQSAMRELTVLIPERPPYRLSLDHPLYQTYYKIREIRFRPHARLAGAKNDRPAIIGIDIGCRTAVFFFRWDVSCGWDDLEDSDDHHCLGYETMTAKQIGANLMAYITAERQAAIPLSKALAYVDAERRAAGKFVLAQGRYDGPWRTRDAGLSMLLKTFHQQTEVPVRFERREIDFSSQELFDTPFVYLTGHEPFAMSSAERANLRRYLMHGGVLFAESCCGRRGFDESFRREVGKILEGTRLERISRQHLIFRFPNAVARVTPRPALAKQQKGAESIEPVLLGATINGSLGIIYSPHGLACGWELAQCPYCNGLASKDALAIGVNILSYAITQ